MEIIPVNFDESPYYKGFVLFTYHKNAWFGKFFSENLNFGLAFSFKMGYNTVTNRNKLIEGVCPII